MPAILTFSVVRPGRRDALLAPETYSLPRQRPRGGGSAALGSGSAAATTSPATAPLAVVGPTAPAPAASAGPQIACSAVLLDRLLSRRLGAFLHTPDVARLRGTERALWDADALFWGSGRDADDDAGGGKSSSDAAAGRSRCSPAAWHGADGLYLHPLLPVQSCAAYARAWARAKMERPVRRLDFRDVAEVEALGAAVLGLADAAANHDVSAIMVDERCSGDWVRAQRVEAPSRARPSGAGPTLLPHRAPVPEDGSIHAQTRRDLEPRVIRVPRGQWRREGLPQSFVLDFAFGRAAAGGALAGLLDPREDERGDDAAGSGRPPAPEQAAPPRGRAERSVLERLGGCVGSVRSDPAAPLTWIARAYDPDDETQDDDEFSFTIQLRRHKAPGSTGVWPLGPPGPRFSLAVSLDAYQKSSLFHALSFHALVPGTAWHLRAEDHRSREFESEDLLTLAHPIVGTIRRDAALRLLVQICPTDGGDLGDLYACDC